MASVIKGVIEEVQATHGQGKIVAIVTDQGSNFVRARRVISNEETILSINCGAHMPKLKIFQKFLVSIVSLKSPPTLSKKLRSPNLNLLNIMMNIRNGLTMKE